MGAMSLALLAFTCEARSSYSAVLRGQTERRASVDQDRAAAMVQRSTGGRVLSVDTVVQGGREIHRVKVLLSGGRIRVITVDGQTGDMY